MWVTLNLTFQGYSRSNVMMSLDSSYMVSYWYISNYMSNSHRLALIAAQKVFSYLLPLGLNDQKSQVHRMTLKWPSTEKGTLYMLKYYPRVPNFTPCCSTIARFPDNWGFWFLHRLQWYFRKKIVKNRKLKISKIPNVDLWELLWGKFRTSFKTFACDL